LHQVIEVIAIQPISSSLDKMICKSKFVSDNVCEVMEMPLRNRVTPFGDIIAIPQRGLMTGNRGIIHDPLTRTLLKRRWSSKAWLVCVLECNGVRRKVMGPGSWTELFFLDEAVALSAGHRPCFFCRRDAALSFRAAWASGTCIPPPAAPAMDAALHSERLDHGSKRIHRLTAPVAALPDGSVVVAGGAAYTIVRGLGFRWTEQGYGPSETVTAAEGLLTPPSTVRALAAGYRPMLHPDLHPA
jgi:hypothetical protein